MRQQPNPPAEPALPPRVLIVDDAPAMRAALRGLLEDHGLPVVGEAADGLQAVTMAEQFQPDVVVMDVRMPGLDGLQATTRITGAHPTIRVVVYSVFDSDQTQLAAHLAGAACGARKPGFAQVQNAPGFQGRRGGDPMRQEPLAHPAPARREGLVGSDQQHPSPCVRAAPGA